MSPLSHSINAPASSRSSADESSSSMTNETTVATKDNNARSPVITAQQRKRMIRERRQRKQPLKRSNSIAFGEPKDFASPASRGKRSLLLRRSHSLPQVVARTTTGINNSGTKLSALRTSPPTRKQPRSIPQLGSPLSLMSTSNSLFAHVGGRRRTLTRRSSLSSSSRSLVFTEETTLQPTNLCSNGDSNQSHCLTPKPSGIATSLFGAVMKRATTTPKTGDNEIGTNAAGDENPECLQEDASSNMSAATPVKTCTAPNRHVMWNLVSTPSQKVNGVSKRSRVAASPGGFGLLQVLDSVTSPFRKAESPSASIGSSPGSPQHDRFDEWHDGDLDDDGICVWDWSIKKRIRIESHPDSCSPASFIACSSTLAVETLALQNFLGVQSCSSLSTVDNCQVQWGAGLMYWQHPAVHQVPQETESNTENIPPNQQASKAVRDLEKETKNMDAKESKSVSKSSKAKVMGEAVRGNNAYVHHLVRFANPLDKKALKDGDLAMKHRQYEWQQAFRSLYMLWQQRVDAIQIDLDAGKLLDQSRIARSCFYSVASEHLVLFRTRSFLLEEDGEAKVVPMIVLTGATAQVRDKLDSMGIELTLLAGDIPDKQNKMASEKAVHKDDEEEATLVKTELEALRRAQVDGVTAGADVSVSMKQKRGNRFNNRDRRFPVCIDGEQDCAAFYEVYLNTCGFVDISLEDRATQDVPLLLSRRLGPFHHSSLKSLSVTSRRVDNPSQKLTTENGDDQQGNQQQHSTIELRGPILPCALSELVHSTTSRMMFDEQHQCEGELPKRRNGQSGGEQGTESPHEHYEVGSHYFVLHLQTLEGHQESLDRGFALLNGAEAKICQQQSASLSLEQKEQECRRGEVLSTLVWDVSRPDEIIYKVEPTASNLSPQASAG